MREKLSKPAPLVIDRVTARDEYAGIKTEVDAEARSDGTIVITDIRQWRHEIDAEPAIRAALNEARDAD